MPVCIAINRFGLRDWAQVDALNHSVTQSEEHTDLKQLREGHAESFAALLEEHRPSLRILAAAEVGPSDADDVVQDAAIAALGKWNDFTPGTNFRAWMAAFVRFRAANHRRGERRHRKRLLRLSIGRSDQESQREISMPGLNNRLQNAMGVLSEDQRACLVLRVVGSHSYDEISEILSISPTTARTHVFRARRLLADRLGSDGESEEVRRG